MCGCHEQPGFSGSLEVCGGDASVGSSLWGEATGRATQPVFTKSQSILRSIMHQRMHQLLRLYVQKHLLLIIHRVDPRCDCPLML